MYGAWAFPCHPVNQSSVCDNGQLLYLFPQHILQILTPVQGYYFSVSQLMTSRETKEAFRLDSFPLCMVIFLLFKERKKHFPPTIYLYFVFSFTLLILPDFLVKYIPVPAVCLWERQCNLQPSIFHRVLPPSLHLLGQETSHG